MSDAGVAFVFCLVINGELCSLHDEAVVHKSTHKTTSVAVLQSRVWDRCLISWLWCWPNQMSESSHKIHFLLCFNWVSPVCTIETWGYESRNLPCHQDKDRNGVRPIPCLPLSSQLTVHSCIPPMWGSVPEVKGWILSILGWIILRNTGFTSWTHTNAYWPVKTLTRVMKLFRRCHSDCVNGHFLWVCCGRLRICHKGYRDFGAAK